MQSKVVVQGKVEKKSNKKYKIKKEKKNEVDIEIDIEEEGNYEVEKLSIDGLPAEGVPYIYTGPIEDDTIEMSDGDPGIGTI